MGILSFFGLSKTEARSASSLANPEPWLVQLLRGHTTTYGQSVTLDTTLGLPALWGAYRILSESIASLPIEVYERRSDGNYPAEKLKARHLLRLEPNSLYSAYDLKALNILDLASTGNYFNRIYRKNGEIDEIIRIDPKDVTLLISKDGRKLNYEVNTTDKLGHAKKLNLDHDDVEHVKIMSLNGFIGRSPITACMEAFGMMLAAQQYGASFYANGAHLTGILSSPLNLTKEQQKALLEAWNDRVKADKNGTAILGSDMKYTRISATPAEADLINILNLTDRQINQIFRIPAHLNGDLTRSTNNNIEQQSLDFLTHCLRPILKAIENEKNRKYWLTESNRKKYFVDFNLDAMLRANTEARASFYNTMVTLGIFSINEVRALERMNSIENGDKHRVQMNMIDLDKTGHEPPSPPNP
jgi:HK97 family phage portal protein